MLGIDKPGGKGVRVLCLQDAFGKTLSKLALDFVTDRPSTHQYGFTKKQRQEGTNGVHERCDVEDETDETQICDTIARICESFLQGQA